MARRVTQADLASLLADLKGLAQEMGIEGAQYWQVENPWGPTGLHLIERHHDDGHWVKSSTALGSYSWSGPKEAHAAMTVMWRTLHAARKAAGPSAVEMLADGPEPRDNDESARNLYGRQSQWLREQS